MSRIQIMRVVWAVFLLVAAGGLALADTQAEQSPPEGERHEEVDWSMSCLECHLDMTPEVTEAWENGRHGQTNIGCFICHGDGVESFAAKPDTASCLSCHDDKTVAADTSAEDRCLSCHGEHTLRYHHPE